MSPRRAGQPGRARSRRPPARRGRVVPPGPHGTAAPRPLKTLERVLSKAGVCSRTEAREWIRAGRVSVDGRTVTDPDCWVDLERARVRIDGARLQARDRMYLLLHKPTGYLTTYKDPQGRPTVYDLLDGVDTFVSPVGRLDRDTSGLLLLTNDTQFAERVTNPESHVPKTYVVYPSVVLTDAQLQRLRDGLDLSDGPTRPAAVVRRPTVDHPARFEITISEGRNRQVRRMVEALGAAVLALTRVAIGPVRLGDTPPGTWRPLTPREVDALRGHRP